MTRFARFAVVVVLSASAGIVAQGLPSGTVVIDGRKNPEKFPEWYIWEQTFLRLELCSAARLKLNLG